MRMLRKALAVEEISDGKTFHEIEHTLYGRIVNMTDLLKAASKEHHEQWEIKLPKTDKNAGKGTMRVRMTIPDVNNISGTDYVQTIKVKTDDGHVDSNPSQSSEEGFKQFAMLAEAGMIKDRFNYPIVGTDLVWEIDLFYLPDAEVGSGKYHEWVKIDLETPDADLELPELPIEIVDIFVDKKDKSEEQEAFLSGLYDNYFLTKNKFI